MISKCSYGCTPPCHDSLHSGPPAPLSPIALDFEAAKKTLLGAEWEFPKRVKDNLNAQLRTIVARVAQEEREKYEGRIKALESPTMWWNTGEECWHEDKASALDDLECGKVYVVETARQLTTMYVVQAYDEAKDEYINHEFPTRDEADAFLRGTP